MGTEQHLSNQWVIEEIKEELKPISRTKGKWKKNPEALGHSKSTVNKIYKCTHLKNQRSFK
jgi:hypothetical protein